MIHSAVPQSTAVSRIEFDDQKQQITVTFTKGGSVTEPCDQKTFEAFKLAPSAGKFFNERFKSK